MAKIKCPSCGATNQDVTEKEECWQCGTVLGASGAGKSGDATTLETPPGAEGASTQKVLRNRPEGPSPLDRFMVDKPKPNRAPLVIAIVVILLILLVLAAVLLSHK